METKHTPGPWEIVCEGGGEPAAVYGQPKNIYASGLRVASMCGPGNDPAAWLANARLIAAAPELLEALEHLKRHVAECNAQWETDCAPIDTKDHGLAVCLNNRAGDLINAAIEKAKGGK